VAFCNTKISDCEGHSMCRVRKEIIFGMNFQLGGLLLVTATTSNLGAKLLNRRTFSFVFQHWKSQSALNKIQVHKLGRNLQRRFYRSFFLCGSDYRRFLVGWLFSFCWGERRRCSVASVEASKKENRTLGSATHKSSLPSTDKALEHKWSHSKYMHNFKM
jgi:hypothetical protein